MEDNQKKDTVVANDDVRQTRERFENEIAALKTAHALEMEEAARQASAGLESAQEEYERRMQALKNAQAREIKKLKPDIERANAKFRDEVALLKTVHQLEIKAEVPKRVEALRKIAQQQFDREVALLRECQAHDCS